MGRKADPKKYGHLDILKSLKMRAPTERQKSSESSKVTNRTERQLLLWMSSRKMTAKYNASRTKKN